MGAWSKDGEYKKCARLLRKRCLCDMQAPTVDTAILMTTRLCCTPNVLIILKWRCVEAKNMTNCALLSYKFLCTSYEHVVIKFEARLTLIFDNVAFCGPGYLSRYCDSLRTGRSRVRIAVGVIISAPVQTGPGVHPASCKMSTGSLSRKERGRGVALSTHPHIPPRLRRK